MTDALIDIGSARILVVDDLPANLDVLIAAVEGAGFTVLVATSGANPPTSFCWMSPCRVWTALRFAGN
jgi:DNA-binding NtrC family response regulator